MFPMIAFFTATVVVAYILYQYQHQHATMGKEKAVPVGDRVAGVVTEGMMKLMPEPSILDKSKDLDKAKEALDQQQPQQQDEEDGLQQLKTLFESWQQITSDPQLQKQSSLGSDGEEGYKGSNCELLDIKLASMIAMDGDAGKEGKYKSVIVDSLPDGYRDIVVDMISHLEAQPGVSPAKILARHAARTFHAKKIPGIASWSDESICKLLYWEIVAAEKYLKWKNWLMFRHSKKR